MRLSHSPTGSRKAASPGESTESQQTWAGRLARLACSTTRCPACLSFSLLNCKLGMTWVYPFEGCWENAMPCQRSHTLASLPLSLPPQGWRLPAEGKP